MRTFIALTCLLAIVTLSQAVAVGYGYGYAAPLAIRTPPIIKTAAVAPLITPAVLRTVPISGLNYGLGLGYGGYGLGPRRYGLGLGLGGYGLGYGRGYGLGLGGYGLGYGRGYGLGLGGYGLGYGRGYGLGLGLGYGRRWGGLGWGKY